MIGIGPQGIFTGPLSQIGRGGGWEWIAGEKTALTFTSSNWQTHLINIGETLDDIGKHLLVVNNPLQSANGSHLASSQHVWISSTTLISCKVREYGSGTVYFSWDIIKVPGSTQTGLETWSPPTATTAVQTHDITINTVSDYTKCYAEMLTHGRYIETTTANYAYMWVYDVRLTSNTNLRITFQNASAEARPLNVAWQVHDPQG
jgi:negative regulator of replication initiation